MCFFDASQIEFLLHALQVRLGFDLVIIFVPCSCSAGCSNEHWIGIVVIPTLLNRPSTQCLWCILSFEEVVPRWQWDQAGHWVLSRIWTSGHHNSIWLAQKSFLISVTYALVLRVIMLKNNIKILLVSFVRHIELQNFLNAPRICKVLAFACTLHYM